MIMDDIPYMSVKHFNDRHEANIIALTEKYSNCGGKKEKIPPERWEEFRQDCKKMSAREMAVKYDCSSSGIRKHRNELGIHMPQWRKICPEQWPDIRRECLTATQASVAKRYGVSGGLISLIVRKGQGNV
jgi:hypothetical protein